MATAADSGEAGFLLPRQPPAPLFDDDWDDFLHDFFAGIVGFDPTLVRPRWEPEPAPRPDIDTDWCAFGVMSTTIDFAPAVVHIPNSGNGYDALQHHQLETILVSFYGPNGDQFSSYLQRGLFIDQNRAILRANGAGLVEVSGVTRTAELIKERWWPRSDIEVILRREIRYDYNVRNLLQSRGTIIANPPGEARLVENDWDTATHPAGGTIWDSGATTWDSGATTWD
jgi:hypothetical protein